MKTKKPKTTKRTSQPRSTPAKRIRAQREIWRKLEIARGRTSGANYYQTLKSDEDFLGLVEHVRWFGPKKIQLSQNLIGLGTAVGAAILDNDHKFFSRIAAILQFNRKPIEAGPELNRLYKDALAFCFYKQCGTDENPCEPWALLAYLKTRGHRFTEPASKLKGKNQLPRTFHALCRRLGISLLVKRPGRPRINSQR